MVVEDAEAPKEKPQSREQDLARTPPVPDPPAGPDDGMIGPSIGRMPSEQDMRPTVNTGDNASLIARPPSDEATSE